MAAPRCPGRATPTSGKNSFTFFPRVASEMPPCSFASTQEWYRVKMSAFGIDAPGQRVTWAKSHSLAAAETSFFEVWGFGEGVAVLLRLAFGCGGGEVKVEGDTGLAADGKRLRRFVVDDEVVSKSEEFGSKNEDIFSNFY